MSRRTSIRVVLGVTAAAVSLTCGGDGAGPDPNAVATIAITPDGSSLDTGDSLQLSAVARNAGGANLSGKTFSWSTLDPTLVTVSGTGLVHGHWPGAARIVATSEQHADTASLHVIAKIDSIVLIPALDTLRAFGDQRLLTVVPYIGSQAYDGGQYTWALSDTTFLFLQAGVPTPLAAAVDARRNGSTIVRVHEARGAGDSGVIVVRQRVAGIIPVGFRPTLLYRACPMTQLVAVFDAHGFQVADAVLHWRSSDTTRARVDSTGLITPLAVGADTIAVSGDTATLRIPFTVLAAPVVSLLLAGPGAAPVSTVGRAQDVSGSGVLTGATEAPARYRITSSDTTIATVVPADTAVRVSSQSSDALRVIGRSHGTVTLTPYLCDVPGPSIPLYVTTPRLTLIDTLPHEARTDDVPKFVATFLQDSARITHFSAEPLTIRVATTDTTVMQADSNARHVPVGTTAVGATVTYRDTGTARLVISDSASVYQPDSSPIVHVVFPPLFLISDTMRLGMRQLAFSPSDPHYVYVDRYVAGSPLPVTLSSSDTAVARITPAVADIPVGNTAVPIVITGGDTRGIATLTAQANRHRDTSSVVVVSRPAATSIPYVGIFYPGDTTYYQVVTTDSATGASHAVAEPVTFTVASSDPTVLTLDSTTLTVPVGSAVSTLTPVILKKAGTASITASDPRAVPYSYLPGSSPVTVTPTSLQADSVLSLGLEQNRAFEIVVNGPLHGQAVHVAHNNPAVAALGDTTATLFVPGLAIVIATGMSVGVDSVIASAPGFAPDTGTIVVGLGTGDLATWPPFGLTVGQTWPLQLNILAPNGDPRLSTVTKTFTLTANGSIDFLQDSVPITTVTVFVNNQSSSPFVVRGKAAGTGTVTISAPNYAPVTKSVTVTP